MTLKQHHEHHHHMMQDFLWRFWVSLVLTVPILLLSPSIQKWFAYEFTFLYQDYLLFTLSSFIFFYGGYPFLRGALGELRLRTPGMMTLIAVAIIVAYAYSNMVLFGVAGTLFFWELATLIDVMLLGHYIEMRSVLGASRALQELARLMPAVAHKEQADGTIIDVALDELAVGDLVLVRPGEKVPADGRVMRGQSELNEAALTGESIPVAKRENDTVIGGSINGNGVLTVQVQKRGEESYLAQVIAMVEKAQQSKSRVQSLADRAAAVLTLVALVVGTLTFFGWLLLGSSLAFSLERMVSVMVITCPHALGLAIPLVIATIAGISAQAGLLIRNKAGFEQLTVIDIVVFDKTGTLTKGEFGVTDVLAFGDWSPETLLAHVGSLEVGSEHSIARAIVQRAQHDELKLPKAQSVEAIPGVGVRGEVEGQVLWVGNSAILSHAGLPKEVQLRGENEAVSFAQEGKTVVLVCGREKLHGVLALADVIREESRSACERLQSLGYTIAMITGDNEVTAQAVGRELGIQKIFARVLPDEKAKRIEELQREGNTVAMVGDGVNDAPALTMANVGIAIGAGSDVALESADIILTKNNPGQVADAIALSRIMKRKMIQNLAWATGYNVFAIPLAAGLLAPWGIVLPPAVGALIMSLSTVIVALNAQFIRLSS